ncbi:MAG TPA: NAD(P)/FAD-dependent oxidoreductase [Anaerolineaceae bacterium]
MAEFFDVIIIGGGIVGCMTARYLSRYQLKILLVEKESDIGMGASSANSAIIHAGYDPAPGTLKASMNVAGNAQWDSLAGELNFHFDRRGDFVVAIGQEEVPALESLFNQGRRNGVPGMRMISGEEMRRREPGINPAVSGALWAYTGGVVDPFNATIAAAENALHNGVKLLLKTSFINFILDGTSIVGINTNRGEFGCRWVVNAAGLYADEVMHKAGVRPEFEITPRRGEYFVLDRSEISVNNVLFPVPTRKGKGILVTGTTHGNPIVGPTSTNLTDKEDRSSTPEGQEELWQGARKLVPSLKINYVISSFVGLRATGNAHRSVAGGETPVDFIIEIPGEVGGLVNLGGIESPGLTSAPAIAQRVVDLLKDAGLEMVEKPGWDPIRPPRPRFCELERTEQALLVAQDPRYGRIICRCEMVTEGEIVAEVHGPIPATTYDAIKRRTWLGTGRCLGSFDTPRVVSILAEELGESPLQITKKGPGSEFLVRETKTLEV